MKPNTFPLLILFLFPLITDSQNSVVIEKKMWLKNEKGEIISPVFDYIGEFNENGIALVNNGGRFLYEGSSITGGESGLINRSGNLILPMYYHFDSYNPNGLSVFGIGCISNNYGVTSGGKFGILNNEGKIILPADHEKIISYRNVFFVKKDKWAIYNSDMQNLSGFVFDYITPPDQSAPNTPIACRKNHSWGYIDEKGKEITPFQFSYASNFSKDRAIVGFKGNLNHNYDEYSVEIFGDSIYQNSDFGIINASGKLVSSEFYQQIEKEVIGDTYFRVSKNEKLGIIDHNGKTVIPAEYETLEYIVEKDAFLFSKYNKFGIISSENKIRIKPIYDKMESIYNSNFFIVNKGGKYNESEYKFIGGKYGVININGKEIVDCKYESLFPLNEFFVFQLNGKFGLFNQKFEIIQEPVFDNIEYFDYSTLKVQINDPSGVSRAKYGLLDAKGNLIAKPEFEFIGSSEYNLILAAKNGYYGYIDANGKELIPFIYFSAGNFQDGVAKVCRADDNNGKKCGFIDEENNLIIPIEYELEEYELLNQNNFIVKKEGKYGVINKKNKIIIPTDYTYIWREASEKIFILNKDGYYNLEQNIIEGGEFSLMNYFGEPILPSTYKNISRVEDQADFLYISSNNREYGIYDMKNACMMLPEVYTTFRKDSYREKHFIVSLGGTANEEGYLENGKYGVVDENNAVIIPIQYESISPFENYYLCSFENKFGIIDTTGKTILPFEYDDFEFIDGSLIKLGKGTNPVSENFVYSAGKYGVYDIQSLKLIVPCEYENFFDYSPRMIFKKDNLIGIMDKSGKLIISATYSGFEYSSIEGTIIVSNYVEGRSFFGVVDLNGKVLIPLEYDSIVSERNYFICSKEGKEYKINSKNEILPSEK